MTPIIIGLTGNIASGKSEVEKILQQYNIPVIDADKLVHQIYAPKSKTYNKIINYFKKHNYDTQKLVNNNNNNNNTKKLNTKFIREIIFDNPTHRKFMEQLIHPQVRKQIAQFVDLFKQNYKKNISTNISPNINSDINQQKYPFCLVSIPLLYSKDNYPYLDKILFIDIDHKIQLQRLKTRDNISLDLAEKIIQAQPNRNQLNQLADDVIINDSNLIHLKQAVDEILDKYLKNIKK